MDNIDTVDSTTAGTAAMSSSDTPSRPQSTETAAGSAPFVVEKQHDGHLVTDSVGESVVSSNDVSPLAEKTATAAQAQADTTDSHHTKDNNVTYYDHVFCEDSEGQLTVTDTGLLFQPYYTYTATYNDKDIDNAATTQNNNYNIPFQDMTHKSFPVKRVEATVASYTTHITVYEFHVGIWPSRQVIFQQSSEPEWHRLQCDLEARTELTVEDEEVQAAEPEEEEAAEVEWDDEVDDDEDDDDVVDGDENINDGWSAQDCSTDTAAAPPPPVTDSSYYPVYCKQQVGTLRLTSRQLQFLPDQHSASVKSLPWNSFASPPFYSPWNYPQATVRVHYHTTHGPHKMVGFDVANHNVLEKLKADMHSRLQPWKNVPRERVYVAPRQPHSVPPPSTNKKKEKSVKTKLKFHKPGFMKKQSHHPHPQDTSTTTDEYTTTEDDYSNVISSAVPLVATTPAYGSATGRNNKQQSYHDDESPRRIILLFMSICCIITSAGLSAALLYGYFFAPRRSRNGQYVRTRSPLPINDYLQDPSSPATPLNLPGATATTTMAPIVPTTTNQEEEEEQEPDDEMSSTFSQGSNVSEPPEPPPQPVYTVPPELWQGIRQTRPPGPDSGNFTNDNSTLLSAPQNDSAPPSEQNGTTQNGAILFFQGGERSNHTSQNTPPPPLSPQEFLQQMRETRPPAPKNNDTGTTNDERYSSTNTVVNSDGNENVPTLGVIQKEKTPETNPSTTAENIDPTITNDEVLFFQGGERSNDTVSYQDTAPPELLQQMRSTRPPTTEDRNGDSPNKEATTEKQSAATTLAPTISPTTTSTTPLPTLPTIAPTASPTASTTLSPTLFRTRSNKTVIELLSDKSFDRGEALRTTGTPQQAAYLLLRVSGFLDELPSDDMILQKYALSTVYYAAGGQEWTDGSVSWVDLSSSDCVKEHIVCDEPTQTTLWIDMPSNHLKGSLTPEIALLSRLQHLDISKNEIAGTLPSELGVLTDLEMLDLSNNPRLEGTVPKEIQNLPNLKTLKVDLPLE